jgi:hypothetical protein
MITILLVLHAFGAGASFIFLLGSSIFGEKDPLWQVILASLFWEIPLTFVIIKSLFEDKS